LTLRAIFTFDACATSRQRSHYDIWPFISPLSGRPLSVRLHVVDVMQYLFT